MPSFIRAISHQWVVPWPTKASRMSPDKCLDKWWIEWMPWAILAYHCCSDWRVCLSGFRHKLIKFIAGVMMRFVRDLNALIENLIKEYCQSIGNFVYSVYRQQEIIALTLRIWFSITNVLCEIADNGFY